MIRTHILTQSASVPESEFSIPFVQGMMDRMGLSFFKYGKVAEAYPTKVNAIESVLVRLISYMGWSAFSEAVNRALAKTSEPKLVGNTEYLIDAGNFAMIEFMHPAVEGAFFEATDSDKSPGRSWNKGSVNQSANTLGRENVRRGGSNLTTAGGFYKREGD